jgi:site-specific DNA recombinase
MRPRTVAGVSLFTTWSMTVSKTEPTPAVGYVRMSTDKQQDSPARQKADVNAMADRHGYAVVAWYEDHGKSGTESKKRGEFQRLLKDATAGKFKVLLLSEQSRMSREDTFEQIAHLKVMRDAGVKVVTCQQGELDFANLGGMVTAIVGAHGAHDESRKIADRTTGGKRLAVSRGRRLAPGVFGFDRVVTDERGETLRRVHFRERFQKPRGCVATLVPSADPVATGAVRHAFAAVADGARLADVARWFNERGILSGFGNAFLTDDVRRMLTNPVYVGDLCVGTGRGRKAKFARVMPEERVFRDAHPALVSRDVFDAVQSVLRGRRSRRTRAESGRYLLAGVLHCGHCGCKMHGAGHPRGEGPRGYRCPYVLRGAKTNADCPHPHVKREWIEAAVTSAVRDRLLTDRNREFIRERLAAVTDSPESESPDRRRLAELQADIVRGERNLARAETDEDYAAVSRNLSAWREEAESVRARLRTASPGRTSADAVDAIAMLEWMCENADNPNLRAKLADCVKQSVRRVEVSRAEMGETFRGKSAALVGVIHFNPDLYPNPVRIPPGVMARSANLKIVLDRLAASDRPLPVRELCDGLGLHRTTVVRELSKAVALGFVESADSRLLSNGSKLWRPTDAYRPEQLAG